MIDLAADPYPLPPGMPPCPDPDALEHDPGMHFRPRRLSGPRRPVLARSVGRGGYGLLEPRWAASKWRQSARSNSDSLLAGGTVDLWLSAPQLKMWNMQILCAYCGAGIGEPCTTRSEIGPVGPTRTRVASYFHKPRRNDVARLAIRVPRAELPGWVWWAIFAVGNDPRALGACMLGAGRDAGVVREYVERFDQELVRGW